MSSTILRNHFLGGAFDEMSNEGVPEQPVSSLKDAMDCNIYFLDTKAEISEMYIVLGIAIIDLIL